MTQHNYNYIFACLGYSLHNIVYTSTRHILHGGEPDDRILMSDVTYSTFGVQCKLKINRFIKPAFHACLSSYSQCIVTLHAQLYSYVQC